MMSGTTTEQVEHLIAWARRQARIERRRYMIRAVKLDGRPAWYYEVVPAMRGVPQ